ncbi:MAG: thioredoxin domain-containing protein [Myxococcota bacterium]|nr:thioredoxin domain-containing protein [Myxococcota bacterium]
MSGHRLADATSPYLRQHADNPVDWYPWGPEALARARAEDRPVLLSIGYSACHWCHVMERESFEDPETAALMNERFVNVKVDREERPDLDHVYQTAAQLLGRGGGWPLTVFLTPDLRPFFAGTYFPPTDRHGLPAFRTVLRAVSDAYREHRAEVDRSADAVTGALRELLGPRTAAAPLPADTLQRAARALLRHFDDVYGGFGSAPKFPHALALALLLRVAASGGEPSLLARVRLALDAMRDGGIHDAIGGGFHRYAVDAHWSVPHFEKMLYDNALLLRLYADAYRVTHDASYAQLCASTARWMLDTLGAPDGALYASLDADSEGEEGRYYVWTPQQVDAVCGPDEGRLARMYWGIAPGGNFERGTSVPRRTRTLEALAAQVGLDVEETARRLERARRALLEARSRRPPPSRDEKVIASWNGLAIGALCEAGMALGARELVEAGWRALEAVRARLWRDGRLSRISFDGRAAHPGCLEDYAELACAALDVAEAYAGDGSPRAADALGFAGSLVDAMLARFGDADGVSLRLAGRDVEDLIVAPADAMEGSTPSAIASAATAMLRIAALRGQADLGERAVHLLQRYVQQALDQPMGHASLLCAADLAVHGPIEVRVVGTSGAPETVALLDVVRRAYVPRRVLLHLEPGLGDGALRSVDGKPTAYVCSRGACGPPIVDAEGLREALRCPEPPPAIDGRR